MQTKIDHQKSVADIVLSKLELLDRYCIIAGGAPRDWYLGNEATDIDVYLHYPVKTTPQQRVDLLTQLGFEIKSKHEEWEVNELYEANHHISNLYTCEFMDEKVQIMFVNQPTFTSVVDTFPISISKAWYKKGQIKTTGDFDYSVRHKIIWKTVTSYKDDSKYIVKIKNKFSNYEYSSTNPILMHQEQEKLNRLIQESLNRLGN